MDPWTGPRAGKSKRSVQSPRGQRVKVFALSSVQSILGLLVMISIHNALALPNVFLAYSINPVPVALPADTVVSAVVAALLLLEVDLEAVRADVLGAVAVAGLAVELLPDFEAGSLADLAEVELALIYVRVDTVPDLAAHHIPSGPCRRPSVAANQSLFAVFGVRLSGFVVVIPAVLRFRFGPESA